MGSSRGAWLPQREKPRRDPPRLLEMRVFSQRHRDGGIRTRDPLNPIQVRYRAALRPVRRNSHPFADRPGKLIDAPRPVHPDERTRPDGPLPHPTEQVMSAPQQSGDLIFPCPFGHFDTATTRPSAVVIVSCTSGASHLAHVAFTSIPHFSQAYVAIGSSLFG